MIAHALCSCGVPALLGGNIGGSLLARLPLPLDHALVLELSSAMLHWLGQGARAFAPRVAVWTNLSPNHLDWHGTLAHYGACKAVLLRHQGPDDHAVLGPGLRAHAPGARAHVTEITGPLDARLRVPGAHNRLNAHFALRACLALAPHLSREAVLRALESFPGLDHRLCLVHTSRDGRRFYNDSKCTTVGACLQAIEALREDGASPGQIHLIVGGDAKGQDLSALGPLGAQLGGVFCIGRDGPQVARVAPGARVHGTLRQAVVDAHARMAPGDILLLSPACASWDQYPNYEHRGREFAQLARECAP
jgi:UDP-N-acetylmuramoylalanine--D-glutamate ligase